MDVLEVVGESARGARVSPHVERACAHTTAWAEEMGMVGPERDPDRLVVWDRATFDARHFGRFAAHVHPDADAAVLDLLSDWYVWLWYVDDALELVQQHEGVEAAHRFLRGLARRPASSSPANAAERGADDLWPRTAPVVPDVWCQRFRDDLLDMLEEMRAAEANNLAPRVPNPIEYVDARRGFGGMLFSADLVEPGCGTHLDEAIVASRPLRLLRATFADAVVLRNDLLSYGKEIEAGEGPSNGVAVLQHFLRCDPVTAARLVLELRSARLRQFDHVITHDLPVLYADAGLDAGTRAAVDRWVEALRDWMAGDVRWSQESGRYAPPRPAVDAPAVAVPRGPTGLGTSAARLLDATAQDVGRSLP